MSTNYNAKKKPELEALLKERGLAHTGNKADLVSRLQADDASKSTSQVSTTSATAAAPAPAPITAAADEDKIDWDDEETATATADTSNQAAAAAVTEPAHKTALAAGGIGRVDNPVAVPNQVLDEAADSSKTDDLTVKAPAAEVTDAAGTVGGEAAATTATGAATKTTAAPPAPPKKPTAEEIAAKKAEQEKKFTANVAATDAEVEAEKRRKRAAKFGLPTPSADETTAQGGLDEAAKLAKRAAKFGTANVSAEKSISALDSALPERQVRDRKRGRERGDEGHGPGNKRVDSRRREGRGGGAGGGGGARSGNRGGGNRARSGQRQHEKDKAAAVAREPVRSGLSEADRIAAEKRRLRFQEKAAA